jgi:hypothetical protein
MSRYRSLALGVLLIQIAAVSSMAQTVITPEGLDRGKRATALVEASAAEDVTGSAFCIDVSGLFITNDHVVAGALGGQSRIRLVLDIGLTTQRTLPAKVLRHDADIDLALLQVAADPRLTPLALGRNAGLKERATVTTFGYPFGRSPAVGRARYPNITVVPSQITRLRTEKGELVGIEFDNQINPGNSGGPVLDGAGNIVGVAVASVRGAALNLAIPVGRLAQFLATPGLIFDPPPVNYETRNQPETWTVQVLPPTPSARLPEGLSVAVTVKSDGGAARRFSAKPVRDGVWQATVIPSLDVDLGVRDSTGKRLLYGAYAKDTEIRVAGKRFRLSELDQLQGGSSPSVRTRQGQTVSGKIAGLGRATRMFNNEAITIDLSQPIQVNVLQAPLAAGISSSPTIEATAEVRQGSTLLAAVRRRNRVTVATKLTPAQPSSPASSHIARLLADEGLLKLGGALMVSGSPRGAGKAIHPPPGTIGRARLEAGAVKGSETPLVRRAGGRICDVAVGGGGRFLLLTLKDVRKLAVFDVNSAEFVKSIPLPSDRAIVAAGAGKFLVVFPDERLVQRWDLATLMREGGNRPSPIKGRIMRLALGSDSDGPALAFWHEERPGLSVSIERLSFVDLEALAVLKVGSISSDGSTAGVGSSVSGGCFLIEYGASPQWHLRAAPAGALFAVWSTGSIPTGFRTISAHGPDLVAVSLHEHRGQLVPGPDGQTIYTGSGERFDPRGKPIGQVYPPAYLGSRPLVVPSADPAYWLTIDGLPTVAYDPNVERSSTPGTVTVSVHSAGDGARLLTVHGLDELAESAQRDDWYADDFTPEKRFHLVPGAGLLVTIPPANDRLVLRRLDLAEALDHAGTDRLIVVSPASLTVAAGTTLEHQLVARSRKGGISFALARGPDGLAVAPDGKLTWTVPGTLKGRSTSAVVSVSDASGQELFHTVKIRVE